LACCWADSADIIGPGKGSADYQVALPCACLLHAYRFEIADATRRKSAEFRALNPLGQIPVLRDADVLLADSNAIMVYLVKRYAPTSDWLPDDPVTAAAVQRWLSIAPARFATVRPWHAEPCSGTCRVIRSWLLKSQAASLASWSSTFPTGTGLPPATSPWPISPAIHMWPMRQRAVSRSIPIPLVQANAGIAAPQRRVRLAYLALYQGH
jgi:hypothetical protein